MADNGEILYPEIFSNEYVVNIENVRFILRTQKSLSNDYIMSDPVCLHLHPGYEIFLCEKGEVFIKTENQMITLKSGEMLVVPPKCFHSLVKWTPDSKRVSLWFELMSNGQKTTCDLYRLVSKVINNTMSVIPNMGALANALHNVCKCGEENDSYAMSKYVHLMLTKIVELSGNVPEIREGVRIDNVDLRYQKILLYIINHLGEQITLEKISEGLKLSSRHTSRIIKDVFGCSFSALLTKIRMEKAGKLLIETNHRVSEIAEMVGFSSERGFYSAFKNQYGCLPKDYRKNNTDQM